MLELQTDKTLLPSCYPWICYFLTKHYSKLGLYDQAMTAVNQGIEHTPTLVELYVVKAKIFRLKKELSKACETAILAQSLDTADRYTNCIACQYLIANSEIERAEEMLAKFVKETQDITDYLRSLQLVWFEIRVAKICYENKNYAECLRRCHLIKRIFVDMFEDQFDFVQYSCRKFTISSFAEFYALEDVIFTHPAYQLATFYSSKIYLKMLAEGKDSLTKTLTEEQLANSEKLKIKQEQLDNKVFDDDSWGPKKENILDPVLLIKEANPTEELTEFLSNLEKQGQNSILTYTIGAEFYGNEKVKNYPKLVKSIDRGLDLLKSELINEKQNDSNQTPISNFRQAHPNFEANSLPQIYKNSEYLFKIKDSARDMATADFLKLSASSINNFTKNAEAGDQNSEIFVKLVEELKIKEKFNLVQSGLSKIDGLDLGISKLTV